MDRIQIITRINAPIERCFDLARDIDFHQHSLAHTGERAVAGTTTGLIGHGESVTWEAKHFGVTQRLTAKITAFERPTYFQDIMTRGAFAAFTHDHRFEPLGEQTVMTDVITYRAPLGPLGWLAERLFLTRYLKRLITERAQAIKQEAESD